MKFQSLSPANAVLNEKEDYRSGKRLGQYRISSRALYFPSGEYLPFSAVTHAQSGTGSLSTKGCCGLVLPIPIVSVIYDGKKKNIPFDNDRQIALFLAACPGAPA